MFGWVVTEMLRTFLPFKKEGVRTKLIGKKERSDSNQFKTICINLNTFCLALLCLLTILFLFTLSFSRAVETLKVCLFCLPVCLRKRAKEQTAFISLDKVKVHFKIIFEIMSTAVNVKKSMRQKRPKRLPE